MKKLVFVFIFIIILSSSVSAQGFYFDVGLGSGIGGGGLGGSSNWFATKVYFFYHNLMIKTGYGPFDNIPIYFVGDINFRLSGICFDLIGPGIIYYPIPFLQLGLSLGLSIPLWEGHYNYEYFNPIGFAWNISTAYDIGRGKHGCLLGLNIWGATNGTSNIMSSIGIFVKYTYRKKVFN
jgi:hypothetical protein